MKNNGHLWFEWAKNVQPKDLKLLKIFKYYAGKAPIPNRTSSGFENKLINIHFFFLLCYNKKYIQKHWTYLIITTFNADQHFLMGVTVTATKWSRYSISTEIQLLRYFGTILNLAILHKTNLIISRIYTNLLYASIHYSTSYCYAIH